MRRAFGIHKGGKLFCLVNGDQLEYDVGVQVEKFYEMASRGIKGKRNTVDICVQ